MELERLIARQLLLILTTITAAKSDMRITVVVFFF